jgi:hypothetical protein
MRFIRPLTEVSRKDHIKNDILRNQLDETSIVKDAEIYKLQRRDHVHLLNTTKDFPRQRIIIAVK